MTDADFIAIALENPVNRAILDRLPALDLGPAYLTAGCLFQAVWNRQSGRAADDAVKDYDIFYHAAADLSWDAEDAVIRRSEILFADLGVTIEIKNQARVHLWYRDRFGADYPPLASCEDGIDRFLICGTCVGIEAASRRLYAPFGLGDIEAGLLRPNPNNPNTSRFLEKARSYQARWPHLRAPRQKGHAG